MSRSDPWGATATARRRRAARLLAVSVCAVSVGLLVLIGPGVVRPAAAGSLTIGAGSTVRLGDALVNMGCNDLIIQPGGTLARISHQLER